MARTYTYHPEEMLINPISRARFELGDTLVEDGGSACMLCDAEIMFVINDNKNWKMAMYKLAESVCMRLSLETDWTDDGASFSLNQRAERWMKLRDKLQAEAFTHSSAPKSGAVRDSLRNPTDGGHMFRSGMMQSPYVQPPSAYNTLGGVLP